MSAENPITSLESQMLRSLIDLYIETGKPVSSKSLKKRYRLRSSSANIRSILHRLEEKGFLFKPHISAGRVPSDMGYRLYVDGIDRPGKPDRRFMEQLRARMDSDSGNMRGIMSTTSRLISELTNCVGLMVGVFGPGGRVGRIEMVRREGSRALVILRTVDGRERMAEVELDRRYRPGTVDRAVQIINERIYGCPLDEASARLAGCAREFTGPDREIAGAVAVESDYLFGGTYDLEYYLRRTDRADEMPEMRDPRILRALVTLMGEKNLLLRVMRGRIGRGVMVTIGAENDLAEMKDLSIVTRAIPAGRCEGLLGVLGPTRMSYRSVISLLDGMARELTEL
jgi:heat-inducible transcriptional repressor